MCAMSKSDIIDDLAWRYVKFLDGEDPFTIRCFGLARWGDISCWLVGNPGNLKTWKKGIVTTHMTKENQTVWYSPTKEFWYSCVEPVVVEFRKSLPRKE